MTTRTTGFTARTHATPMIFLIAALLLYAGSASALVLRGHFPVAQGRYWNFTGPDQKQQLTWAINGTCLQKNVGQVFILLQDQGRFLCLREDWEGLRIYAEYGPDYFVVPEQPLLLVPAELQPDQPLTTTVACGYFARPASGGDFKELYRRQRTISITLKKIEDMQVGDQLISNGAILERTTREENSVSTETLWLAPTVGPVKVSVQQAGKQANYALASYAGPNPRPSTALAVQDFFPLQPGTLWTYRDSRGKPFTIEARPAEELEQFTTVPFIENNGDGYSYALTPQGLVLVQLFWSMMNGCTLFKPPYPPVVVLPARLELGSHSSSLAYPRITGWPVKAVFEDFHPALEYGSTVVAVEDVSVPMGVIKGCLKLALFSISRNFDMRIEKFSAGYVWLGRDKGIVKEELVDVTNFFSPQRVNEVSSDRFLQLESIQKAGTAK
jgi:hypothetical protein